MKRCKLYLLWSLLTISVWMGKLPVLAQQSESYARQEPTHAYWKLKADYDDQKPIVQFFDAHRELLYQEKLPGTSNRITKRTLRAFDILLANLTTNRILATTYLANDDLLTTVSTLPIPAAETNLKQDEMKGGIAVFSAFPTLNQMGKLTVRFAQLNERIAGIVLEDEERRLVYYEDYTHLNAYKRTIDLEQMPGGIYYLRIKSRQSTFVYRITIDRIMNQYDLRVN